MTHPARTTARLAPALVLTLLAAALPGVPFARNTAAPTATHALAAPLLAGDNDKGGMGG
ncbi:hypothetical protein [Deinococcus planocerae]|uniref:hypothetical protein n=1 Tax=Deinococcus planocerae TaxID=1737569 RepID=UPI0015E10050|nr:hypothetical protein [Deinococcus planocerae]